MKYPRRVAIGVATVLCTVATSLASAPLAAVASVAQASVVSPAPAASTPHIVLGTTGQTVYAFAQIGTTMYAGGRFTQVQNPGRTITYPRQNFAAFNTTTGAVSALDLSFSSIVETLVPSTDGKALYIGGAFKSVNGVASKAIIKYDLVNNRVDPTFNAPTTNGVVYDAKLVNGRLIVGGTMTGQLLALDPNTGANTGYINVALAGVTNTGDITKVLRFDTDPGGTRLVAVGNWATVAGQPRRWAFELTLGPTTATLNTWHAARLDVACHSKTPLNIAQGVDFSPDGSYFVIVTTGGPSGVGGLCDAAGRYAASNIAGTAGATWVNFTGGDSLYSVAVTGSAVYVGGHERWLDNPQGLDSAGPGAVARPGIGAIDPTTGKANSWNPTKSRNHGVQKLYATSTGLWVGSDGQYFDNRYHAGIAFCPLLK